MCSESVTATLQPLLEDCCVAPFIPLAHQVGLERRSEEQIISRVGVENPLLFSLIRRMTDDYPFHVIPYVFVFLPIHCVVVAAVPETGEGGGIDARASHNADSAVPEAGDTELRQGVRVAV